MNAYPEFFLKWSPGELNHATGFHKVLAAKLPSVGKVLDLGCGNNCALAGYRTSQREVWGADFGEHQQLNHPDWFRRLGADGAIPFADETLDLVTSFMVMEHVTEPARFFGEIGRVLKPGGWYIGQSIHSLHYVTWIRRLFDIVPHAWVQRLVKRLYGRDEADTFSTCYRLNRQGAIAKFARATNLDWVEWHAYASPGYFLFSPALCRLAVLADWSLERTHRGLGKIYFTVVLRKPLAVAADSAPLMDAA
jgi:SAM-dependent methyltransferase